MGCTGGIDIVTFVRTSYWNAMVYDIIPPAAMGLAFLIHDLLPVVVTRVTDANSGAGTAYISGAPEFTPVCMDFVLLDLRLCVVFCRSLFVLFLVVIIFSIRLRLTDSDCPFGIFKQDNLNCI